MKRVLVSGIDSFDEAVLCQLESSFDLVRIDVTDGLSLARELPTIDGYILGGDERLKREHLVAAKKLKAIAFVGVGAGSFIDLASAEELEISVSNTPGANSVSVAEHAIGMTLALVKRLAASNFEAKNGKKNSSLKPLELSSMKIGIVGLGSVGLAVASRIGSWCTQPLLYHSRSRRPDAEHKHGLAYRELRELFVESDIVILSAPYTAKTEGMIDREILSGSGDTLYLINVADARLVKSEDLKNALAVGDVSGCAFDGYWQEPIPHPSVDPYGFLSLPDSKFVISPHVAGKTAQAWTNMQITAVANLIAALDGHE